MKLLLFGPAREAIDMSSVEIKKSCTTVCELRQIVVEEFPELEFVVNKSIFAVNNKLIPRTHETDSQVCEHDALVLVPPVSGG